MKQHRVLADHTALGLSKETAQFFGRDDSNFRELMNNLATGNIKGSMEVAIKGGLSEEQASLLVRDSSALATLMGYVGHEMCW